MKREFRVKKRTSILDDDKIDFAVVERYTINEGNDWGDWRMVRTYPSKDQAVRVAKKLRKTKGESFIEEFVF